MIVKDWRTVTGIVHTVPGYTNINGTKQQFTWVQETSYENLGDQHLKTDFKKKVFILHVFKIQQGLIPNK